MPAPANVAKVESLLAAMASLKVVDGPKGFVADNVKDFAPFGLDSPSATVELTTMPPASERLVLHVGKPVPDQPERVYVRQGDQDDVVVVDAKAISEIPSTAIAPAQSAGRRHRAVGRDRDPHRRRQADVRAQEGRRRLGADFAAHRQGRSCRGDALLSQIDSIQTSEFLDPRKVRSPELAPPAMTIKIWQKPAGLDGARASRMSPS